jgi:hypothetical protein
VGAWLGRGGGKSDEDVYEVIIMDDDFVSSSLTWSSFEIEGVQWLETATCERGFSLRTQILTAQRHRMEDSLLACLMMICSSGPSLHEKEEVEKFLLAVVAKFKAFKKRVPSKTCGGKRPQCVCVQGQILCSVSAFGFGECCIQ